MRRHRGEREREREREERKEKLIQFTENASKLLTKSLGTSLWNRTRSEAYKNYSSKLLSNK